jgi:hypothetical protein
VAAGIISNLWQMKMKISIINNENGRFANSMKWRKMSWLMKIMKIEISKPASSAIINGVIAEGNGRSEIVIISIEIMKSGGNRNGENNGNGRINGVSMESASISTMQTMKMLNNQGALAINNIIWRNSEAAKA